MDEHISDAVKMLTKYLLLLAAVWYADCASRLDPLVETKVGLIRGLRTDADYSIFLGIPFAVVDPENPFGASSPAPSFESTFEAYNDPSPCPQMGRDNNFVGSLDCLKLNVFVPDGASSSTKLPVIIWLYGGGFGAGYSSQLSYNAKWLVRHDVIIVTINYRVGPYGFFCLDIPEVPGNQGLKDQLLAMRWVKENIAAFGGDTSKITLMGQSAGGISADIHAVSHHERLYDKLILQSGVSVKPNDVLESDPTLPIRIAAQLGLVTEDLSEALVFLKNEDPKAVLEATKPLSVDFRPCIEKAFDGVENMLTTHPFNLEIPKSPYLSVLGGYTSREATRTKNYTDPMYIHNMLGQTFQLDEDFKVMEDIVRQFYIGDAEFTEAIRDNIVDFNGDFSFNYPTGFALKKYVRNGAKNVYQYMFSYVGGESNSFGLTNNLTGASHGDEVGYLFARSEDEKPSEQDQLIIDRMTTLWTNFAKYGNPTPSETELLPFIWTPLSDGKTPYLDIDAELTMKSRPYSRRMAFWALFFKANQQKIIYRYQGRPQTNL